MLYSFVVPIYNDGALARAFCLEMAAVFRPYVGHDDLARDLEVIFVDDGSRNNSVELLKEVCDEFPFARCMQLARNYGQHIATSAGFRAATGDYVGTLNVDMEEAPKYLPAALDALKSGDYDVAGGAHTGRPVGLHTRFTSWAFNFVITRLTGYNIPTNATTMRIMTRRAVDVYNSLTETSRFIPALEGALGFKYVRVPMEQQHRQAGRSSYNFRRRLRLAYTSVISFSDYPLRMAVKAGMVIAGIGMLLALGLLLRKLFGDSILPGFTSTFVLIVFLGGVQISVTGVASLYIGRILAEVQKRPLFVVREIYGGELRQMNEPVLHVRDAAAKVTRLPVDIPVESQAANRQAQRVS